MEIVASCGNEFVYQAIQAVMSHGVERVARGLKFKEIINPTLVLTNPKKNTYILDHRNNNPACFTGDTRISLLNGTEVPIKDLVGVPEFWVYSCTPEGKIVPGRGHSARKTKTVNEICVVTLDNGEKVKCTPDHRFMLRNGEYKEAKDLVAGESLMPLYRRVNNSGDWASGYEEVLHNIGVDKWQLTHQNVVEHCLGGYSSYVDILGCSSLVAHHIRVQDGNNKLNNDPNNLVVMRRDHHIALHADLSSERTKKLWEDPASKFNSPSYRKMVGTWLAEGRKRSSTYLDLIRSKMVERWSDPEDSLRSVGHHEAMSRRQTSRNKVDWCNPDSGLSKSRGGSRARNISTAWVRGAYKDSFSSANFVHIQSEKAKVLNSVPVVCKLCEKTFGNIGALGKHRKAAHVVINHKVVSVQFHNDIQDVYDISVDNQQKTNNFALSSGVFVHNSMLFETLWVYAGRSDVHTLKKFLPRAPNYSDDGIFWRSGYGSRLFHPVNQVEAVCNRLIEDPGTRQAVMVIYQNIDSFVKSKDIPCNDILQFLLRDNKLHLSNFVRSNDAVWGLSGINLFEFTFLQNVIADTLGVGVGDYVHRVGSLHIYDTHYKKCEEILNSGYNSSLSNDYCFGYKTISEFTTECQIALDDIISTGLYSTVNTPVKPLMGVFIRLLKMFQGNNTSVSPTECLFSNYTEPSHVEAYNKVPGLKAMMNEYAKRSF